MNVSESVKDKRILIADDEDFIRSHIAAKLKSSGMIVREASNGQEALDALSFKPDIILLDIKMPDRDGISTTKMIRKLPDFKTVPVILLSAMADKSKLQEGFDAGATDYLAKPVTLSMILKIVGEYLT